LKRKSLAAGVAIVALAAGLVPVGGKGTTSGVGSWLEPQAAQAQNLVGQRVVAGRVIAADEAPVTGATVFLKNTKTKSIRSYSTDNLGHYRFTQVNMSEDLELWAEKDGKKSAVKPVSSWDSRKEFDTELKLK